MNETRQECFCKGSYYFASRGKIAPCYFAIWRQNSPKRHFAASAKIALTLIPTPTLTQTEEKHYFASQGKIATSFCKKLQILKEITSCVNCTISV